MFYPNSSNGLKHWSAFFAGLIVTATLSVGNTAFSHGEKPVLFVAETGADDTQCQDAARPCRTLEYALSKAGKGAVVKVAAGRYEFQPENPAEAIQLIGDIVTVQAGYDSTDYKESARNTAKTFLFGPAPHFRDRLAARGFTLIEGEGHLQLAQAQPVDAVASAVTRYVDVAGVDEGNCDDPNTPCATIGYALTVSLSGDTILATRGAYALTQDMLDSAEARNIQLQGGFAPATAFTVRASVEESSSYIVGPSFKERDKLRERGFTLVQDSKIFDINDSIARESAPRDATGAAQCVGGSAGVYPCNGIDLLARIPLSGFSSNPSSANDIWGFVDKNDNREYAIIGLRNGTAVVDVSDPLNPTEVGTIPGMATTWRDIKVLQIFDNAINRWKAYAYVTADAVTQGLQIIDLTGLPATVSLAATINSFASAHNIYMANIDYATGQALPGATPFAYILGSNLQNGSFRILGLSDPLSPTVVTAAPPGTGYIHDAASLLISDNRTAECGAGHNPCEVLIDYNESTIDFWDVTDKSAPIKLSSLGYPNAQYTHSGWWSKDKKFVFIQDELDERDAGLSTTVHVVDISTLSSPVLAGTWTGSSSAIDHNGFTLGDEYYMSNYRRGLTILDITDPKNPVESRFFDTFVSPADNNAVFNGAWGTYPYLPSGTILVSDIEGGLFLLKKSVQSEPPEPAPGSGKLSFAWANNPTAASYQPSASYAYNPAGPITIKRSGTGRYAVRFVGFGGNGSFGGHVQVVSHGSRPSRCKVAGWSSGTQDFIANVRCFSPTGVPIDERFSVLVAWP